jgi:hypothetical protein
MAPPVFRLSSTEITRVEDYLNDKIQTVSDINNVDSLLASLREQHALQEQQVGFLP